MSEGRTNQPDEQTELLREIRDLLVEQNKLVDRQWADSKALSEQQWAENKAIWDANRRESRRSMIGCFSAIASLAVILLLMIIRGIVSN
ncbi:MAG: hypothetical protein AB7O59_03905 [Pirellulales bacterium]